MEAPAKITIGLIRRMSPIAQAKVWAALEDALLLDLDTLDGVLRETDPLRIATAERLAQAGIVQAVRSQETSTLCVRVSRVFPLRKVA